jgi:hypothetical protein
LTTVRRSIPAQPTPLTPEQRLAKAQRQADRAAAAAAVADASAAAAQADADAAAAAAAVVAADVLVVDAKAEAAQDDADQALLDAANAQTDADTAIIAAGDAADDAADVMLAVDDVVDGTTAFTGLNVGGVNVKPFLDKTDGSKLTNAAGLDTGVVTTAKLAANAASVTARYDSSAEVDVVAIVGGSDPITSRLTIFSVVMTATGSEIQVGGGFYLRLQHSQDDVVLYVVVERVDSVSGSTDKFLATMQSQAISGDGFFTGWQNINFSDTPAAGLVTYYVRVYHTYSIGSPGGFVTWKHRNRTLGFLETKR